MVFIVDGTATANDTVDFPLFSVCQLKFEFTQSLPSFSNVCLETRLCDSYQIALEQIKPQKKNNTGKFFDHLFTRALNYYDVIVEHKH